jgi:hypothetical protein
MAITFDKTWQFDINQTAFHGASAQVTHENMLLALKESLIGFSSNPWTVIGSCDGTSSAMDGTDYWQDAQDDCNWSTGAHSWIVLQQSGINPKFQVCFDLDDSSYTDIIIVVSPVEGFGSANGGTDGSTTARPTATDENVIANGSDWTAGSTTNYNYILNVMQSTDGACTRGCILYNNITAALFFFDKVKNPHPSFIEGAVYAYPDGGSAEIATIANWHDGSKFSSTVSGTNGGFYLSTISLNNDCWPQVIDSPNGLTNEYEVFPIFLCCGTAGRRGTMGSLYDFWWATETGPSHGDTYDGKKAFQFGQMVWPWDGSSAPIIVY